MWSIRDINLFDIEMSNQQSGIYENNKQSKLQKKLNYKNNYNNKEI